MHHKSGYLHALRIIHLALMAGQCIMLFIVFYRLMRQHIPAVKPAVDKSLQLAAVLLSFTAIFSATTIFKKRIAAINEREMNLAEKGRQYRIANIIQWAFLEVALLFVVICYLLTANHAFAALAISLILFFALMGPSRFKMMLQLKLNEQEVDALQ